MSPHPARTSPARSAAFMPDDAVWVYDGALRLGGTNLTLNCDGSEGQLGALLTLAFQRRLPATLLTSVLEATRMSRGGDQVRANLRLAFARLPRVPSARDWPARLAKANGLMARGLEHDALVRAFARDHLVKFDDEQPRVPAGHGRESGQFTSDGDGGHVASHAATAAAIARAAPLLAPEVGTVTIAALSALAGSVGFAAVLGLLFVPTPNATADNGPLPEGSGSYRYDRDEGLLRVLDPSGTVLAAGRRDRAGIFLDTDTGVPFAREVDGAIVFDGGIAAGEDEDARPRALPRTIPDENEPKLCPEPGPDQPGSESASPRAKAYQEQISAMINPQRPLEYGLAMGLVNPQTGKLVHYDECDERTGTMIDAKGPGYAGLLSSGPVGRNVIDGWLKQSLSQIQAAGQRDVVWYFAEQDAADDARRLFAKKREGRERIIIRVVPAVSR